MIIEVVTIKVLEEVNDIGEIGTAVLKVNDIDDTYSIWFDEEQGEHYVCVQEDPEDDEEELEVILLSELMECIK